MSEDDELARALEQLGADYRKDLAGQLDRIETLWKGSGDPDTLRTLVRALHSIAGAAGTFGLMRAGEVAASAEALLERCLERNATPDDAQRAEVEALLRELRAAAT